MAKLNQIIAVVNGKKTEAKKALTSIHRNCSSSELFSGLSRSYQPLDEEGERFPDEKKDVQFTVDQALSEVSEVLADVFDLVATQDSANAEALADVVVDGNVILSQVPVTYLLFLEKQLVDIGTFAANLPTLDVATRWDKDENQGLYVSEPTKTNKTKKVMQHKVLYEATEQHPAQIEKWTEDVSVGTWTTTKFSGAISQVDKKKLLGRIKDLQEAVKFARESANSIEVEQKKVGEQIFGYLFS